MKKALYIIFIMSSMGFTIASHNKADQDQKERRIVAPQTGYIEVSSNSSYALTTGS